MYCYYIINFLEVSIFMDTYNFCLRYFPLRLIFKKLCPKMWLMLTYDIFKTKVSYMKLN